MVRLRGAGGLLLERGDLRWCPLTVRSSFCFNAFLAES